MWDGFCRRGDLFGGSSTQRNIGIGFLEGKPTRTMRCDSLRIRQNGTTVFYIKIYNVTENSRPRDLPVNFFLGFRIDEILIN